MTIDPAGRSRAVPFLVSFLALAPQPAVSGAVGQSDPVVSWGLSAISDWETAPVFLDLSRSMRPFFAFGTEWETMSNDALRDGGFLDADGYPRAVPPGQAGIRTVWAWGDTPVSGTHRKGSYLLTYDGTATLTLGGAASVTDTRHGRITFDNPTGGTFWLDITAIDPDDPPRALSILRTDHVPLAQAGAIFDPAWLALVADARELRFMGWQRMNDNPDPEWSARPTPADATFTQRGVPVEIMVRLANEAGIDPWFTIPHTATAEDIRPFATYVRDHLDPRLKAHVEYSNETWNGAFPQFHWLRDRAVADWGCDPDDWEAVFDYHTSRATKAALVWQEVFGDEAPARLVNILGTQLSNAWLTERQLHAERWEDYEPESYTDPASVFEEIAATTYFGVSVVVDGDLRAGLAERAAQSQQVVDDWLFGLLSAPQDFDSVPFTLDRLAEQRALANEAGLRLVAYEGGQHVHHSFAVDGLTETEATALTTTLAAFVRSDQMADLYDRLWDGWTEIGQGPFMQFTEMGSPSRWGSWGLLAHPDDRTPRADHILARQARGGSWWGEGGGPQYLQGLSAIGTDADDTMAGTDEEDFLAGRSGDDTFPASAGNDGIAGGTGEDRYTLPRPQADYAITQDDGLTRITGPEGTATLRDVEIVTFGNGTSRRID